MVPAAGILGFLRLLGRNIVLSRLLLLFIGLSLYACGSDGEKRTFAALGSQNIRWANFPVSLEVDPKLTTDPQALADLQDAFRFWEERAGKPLFTLKGDWNSSDPPFRGSVNNPEALLGNVIFFQNPWSLDNQVAGNTIVHSTDGVISNAIILLNPDTHYCAGDCNDSLWLLSRRKLIAHELGHFLGLGHAASENDIMFPKILVGGELSHLSVDEAGLKRVTQ
jgi:hypothetical protein